MTLDLVYDGFDGGCFSIFVVKDTQIVSHLVGIIVTYTIYYY